MHVYILVALPPQQDGAMTTVTSNTHAISINPATGEQIAHYAFESAAALDQSLSRAAAGPGLPAGSARRFSNVRN
ncbi:Aldehyde dehydrogenase [Pseudomonas syringae pv. aptata]|uniref:Aldehyde dehydrogenase n=1 Tax=Pseudomonas syringae pv. aptata TaxID=83167 RepID=A0A3M3XL97_PSEAP|nr:Aldehyde dehydrogenase [Pseudomonas syringae pv. aptata]